MTQRLLLIASLLLSAACGKLAPADAALGEACARSADCADGHICVDGRCTMALDRACVPEATRCNGDVVERCRAGGDGWDADEESCATGCSAGACRAVICESGERSCEGDALVACMPNGAGYAFVQACPTGCDPDAKACRTPACTPYSTRCKADDPSVMQACDGVGREWSDVPCGADSACTEGRCLPKVCSYVAGVGEGRCQGDLRESCNPMGTAFEPVEYCGFGCEQGDGVSACAAAACEPGEERCQDGGLERCRPDRRGFAFVKFCQAGCEASGDACKAPSCTPLDRRCGVQDGFPVAEQCSADGAGYAAVETCERDCLSGHCLIADAGCAVGAWRCSGRNSERCERQPDTTTKWIGKEACIGACYEGGCDAQGGCTALVLNSLPAANTEIPADGVSTVLVYTGEMRGADGKLVPDGTLVTFVHDDLGGGVGLTEFASPDLDSGRPGLQRPTLHGRARALVRAPASARNVTVTALVSGTCTGASSLKFGAGTGAKHVWVSEDFATKNLENAANTTAQWDTVYGRVVATPIYSVGTGLSGALNVSAGEVDLWNGHGAGYRVQVIGAKSVTVDTVTPTFAKGDEVLLVNVSGSASSSGRYEFKTVDSVTGSVVRFTTDVEAVYGAADNANLAGQTVFVQRVPHFTNVTVAEGATLTSRGLVEGGSGVLAFRANGTVRVLGAISMAGRGLAADTVQTGSSTPALSRLLLGSGGISPETQPGDEPQFASAGGGVIFVAARTLALRNEYPLPGEGAVSASSLDGEGGTVWLQGGTVVLGVDRVSATGGNSPGRVRVDHGSDLDAGASTVPTAYVGQNGGRVVESNAAYSASQINAATVTAVLGGTSSRTIVGSAISGVQMSVSANDGLDWAAAAGARIAFGAGGSGPSGTSFKFRGKLDTLGDEPTELVGVAIKVEVQ